MPVNLQKFVVCIFTVGKSMRSKQILIGTAWLCLGWSSVALADERLLVPHRSEVEDVPQVRRLDTEFAEFSVDSEPRRGINSTAHSSSPFQWTESFAKSRV